MNQKRNQARVGVGRSTRLRAILFLSLTILFMAAVPQSARAWRVYLCAWQPPGSGCSVGANPNADGGWQPWQLPVDLTASARIFTLMYRQNGPGWAGPTGYYPDHLMPSIPPGGSATWWDIYLWAQDYTPDPPNSILFSTSGGNDPGERPCGYTGHLVLDYVPESAGWTGPMDFWLDLSVRSYFALPLVTTTDPLQGTRMHFTVYAPIPEPTSLLALATGVLGLAWWRKRG